MNAQEAKVKSSLVRQNSLNMLDKLILNYVHLKIRYMSNGGGFATTLLFNPSSRVIKALRDEGYGVDDKRIINKEIVILWL